MLYGTNGIVLCDPRRDREPVNPNTHDMLVLRLLLHLEWGTSLNEAGPSRRLRLAPQ